MKSLDRLSALDGVPEETSATQEKRMQLLLIAGGCHAGCRQI
jgi:hypothetical protein